MKAFSFLKRIEFSDFLVFTGLISAGIGLFFCFSLGWALIGGGAMFLLIGLFGK